jgi:hypothetical protein
VQECLSGKAAFAADLASWDLAGLGDCLFGVGVPVGFLLSARELGRVCDLRR